MITMCFRIGSRVVNGAGGPSVASAFRAVSGPVVEQGHRL